MATAATSLTAAYRDLRADAVTPEMTAAVRRFHLEEFSPAVAKRLAVAPAEGWSLPTSPREWYLHYHYLVNAPKPYGQSRLLSSSTDTSAYGRALAQTQATLGPLVARLGFDNVLLVSPDTLEVFYSYRESTTIGTNLANGPYASSNFAALARALSTSKDEDDYRVGDFEEYRPRLGDPRGPSSPRRCSTARGSPPSCCSSSGSSRSRTRSRAGGSGRRKASARPARST